MTTQINMTSNGAYDIVVAGGAVMGSAVAYELAKQSQGRCRVLVVEPDPGYQRAASALSAGSIRQQFSTAINIDISLYGIAFLRSLGTTLAVDGDAPTIGLHEGGYLYIASSDLAPVMREVHALQVRQGADIVLLEREALKAHFPWLAQEDLALASWGQSGEGWFDGYGLCQAFKRKARALGVDYCKAKVVEVERVGARIIAVGLDNGQRMSCGSLLNTAGASGARMLAERMGFPIPVRAKKRCVFQFGCPETLPGFPLLIDTSGVWVRPEGKDFIAGYSPDDLDDGEHGDDFDVDWSLFEDVIWPALGSRVPAFERIRAGRAWAGHYDMCLPDHNALIGLLPGLDNGYIAAGFSGHGLQQSPAVGRGLAELMLTGAYQTLDLSPLSAERLQTKAWVQEKHVI